jgi:hypothetical protein
LEILEAVVLRSDIFLKYTIAYCNNEIAFLFLQQYYEYKFQLTRRKAPKVGKDVTSHIWSRTVTALDIERLLSKEQWWIKIDLRRTETSHDRLATRPYTGRRRR